MSHCHHNHDITNIKADHLTNAGSVGETVENASNNFLWGYGLAKTFEGGELANIIVGASFTLMVPGAVYAHRKLNKFHQFLTETSHTHSHEPETSHTVVSQNDLTEPLQHEKPNSENVKGGSLQKFQMLGLALDYFIHIGNRSGAITAILSFALDYTAAVPVWGKALIQGGVTLFGAYTSASDLRTCKNAIEKQNKSAEVKEDHEDKEANDFKVMANKI